MQRRDSMACFRKPAWFGSWNLTKLIRQNHRPVPLVTGNTEILSNVSISIHHWDKVGRTNF